MKSEVVGGVGNADQFFFCLPYFSGIRDAVFWYQSRQIKEHNNRKIFDDEKKRNTSGTGK